VSRRSSARWVPALLAASLSVSGCSWIFVKDLPPDYQRGDRIECTTSPAAPGIDTLLALSDVAGALYVAGKAGDHPSSTANALVTSSLAWAIVYTTSAVHGFRATARCREATADAEAPRWRPTFSVRRPPSSPSLAPVPAPAPTQPRSTQQNDDDEPGHRPASAPPQMEY
jgi:hypothetical protein